MTIHGCEQGVKVCFAKFFRPNFALNVLAALSVALLVDLERLSCRSYSISSSVLV